MKQYHIQALHIRENRSLQRLKLLSNDTAKGRNLNNRNMYLS